MIEVSQAVNTAFEWFNKLYANSNVPNSLLEEIDFNADHEEWLITLGFDRGSSPVFGPNAGKSPTRAYKRFKINAESGDLTGVEDRRL